MTNEEINNAKLQVLFCNVLLGNGYSDEVNADLLKKKEEAESKLKEGIENGTG